MQNYTVLKKIGVGSYGSAYVVLRNDAKVKLVLKRINIKDASKEEKEAAHFEAKILKEFHHPFVLRCMDSFQHGPFMCIVTDYCDAGDMYERLKKQAEKRKYLDEKQVLRWLVQICLALQYVHERKILHRDLKTQNIFLTAKGDIMLGDFGIARVLKSKVDMARTVIGTPYYMSPEIVESKPYDYKSDLWSLGCVLFEMLSLKHAFDANDMNGLIMKIIRGKVPPLPSKYSQDLKQLTTQLLSKVPSKRPTLDSILKMKFLQSTIKEVKGSVEPKKAMLIPGDKPRLANSEVDKQLQNMAKNHNKPIPDMRKQLQVQMQKRNIAPEPLSRQAQAKKDLEDLRAREDAARKQLELERQKRLKAKRDAAAKQSKQALAQAGRGQGGREGVRQAGRKDEQALDIAVDLAKQRLENIHKEFHQVRVQARLLEGAANMQTPKPKEAVPSRQVLRQNNKHVHERVRPIEHRVKNANANANDVRRRHSDEHKAYQRERPACDDPRRRRSEEHRPVSKAAPPPPKEDPVQVHYANPREKAKAAQLQRKMEANRKYEEELEAARRSYYQEKRAAMQKKTDLYKESSPTRSSPTRSVDGDQPRYASPSHASVGEDRGYAGNGYASNGDGNGVENGNGHSRSRSRSHSRSPPRSHGNGNGRASHAHDYGHGRNGGYEPNGYREEEAHHHGYVAEEAHTYVSPTRVNERGYAQAYVQNENHTPRHEPEPNAMEGGFVVEESMVYGQVAPALSHPHSHDNNHGPSAHTHAHAHAQYEYASEGGGFEVEESFLYDQGVGNGELSPIEEEESGLQRTTSIDTSVLSQGGLLDKVNAIRGYCLERLGSGLFHELCGLIKLHNSRALTSTTDVEYAGEILERLGEKRIHFAGLIDHLLYLEERCYC